LYADSDETKKQSDHIRNLHIDFMKDVEDDETPGRDGPMLLTNAYDDVLGSNKNIPHMPKIRMHVDFLDLFLFLNKLI
jgi:hypothetical protein